MIPSTIEPAGDGRVIVQPSGSAQTSNASILSVHEILDLDDFDRSTLLDLIKSDYTVTADEMPNIGGAAIVASSNEFDLEVAWPVDDLETSTQLVGNDGYVISGGELLFTTTEFRPLLETHLEG